MASPSPDDPPPTTHEPDLNRPPGQPPPKAPTPTAAALAETQRGSTFFAASAACLCVLCPTVMLLPPRKLDLFTLGLGLAFCTSAGFLLEQRTGHGLVWHVGARIPSERNRERWEQARWERLREQGRMREAEERRERWEEKRTRQGWWKRVWLGAEGRDWLEKRKKMEEEAFDEGKGYGTLIGDQIREVFGFKDDDDDEDEEEEQKKE